MKKLTTLFLSVAAMTAALTSCSKSDPAPATPVATSIQATVVDSKGQPVSGSKLILFDMTNPSKPAIVDSTGVSDVAGKYVFNKGVKNIMYAVMASSKGGQAGCKFGVGGTTSAAVANTQTDVKVVAVGQGTFQFQNPSTTDTFYVYAKNSSGVWASVFGTNTDGSDKTFAANSQSKVTTGGVGTLSFVFINASNGQPSQSTIAAATPQSFTITECNNTVITVQ